MSKQPLNSEYINNSSPSAVDIDNPLNDSKQEMNDSIPFTKPFWKMKLSLVLKEIWFFVIQGLSCALNNACSLIVVFINFIYIGWLEDPLLQASFGLGVSYFMFLYFSLCLACAEVTGIECARHFGLKQKNDRDFQENNIRQEEYEKINEVILTNYNAGLGKGFILTSVILCFSIITFVFCEQILYAINIHIDNCV